MHIYTPVLGIEISRKCNLNCAHCMRGISSNISISTDLIDRLFDEVILADMLVISGGEPFLCYEEIKSLCEIIKRKCVQISAVTIVTNGTVYDDRIYKVLEETFDKVRVNISLDSFHTDSIREIYKVPLSKSTDPRLRPVCLDDIFDNIELHTENKNFGLIIGNPRKLIDMGRAVDVDYSKVPFEPIGYFWTDLSCFVQSENVLGVGPRIYMDALGYITEGNSSYDVREDMSIGNIGIRSLTEMVLENAIGLNVSTYQEFSEFIVSREDENYNRNGKLYTYRDNKVVLVERDAKLKYSN